MHSYSSTMVPSGTLVSTIKTLIQQCCFTKSRKVISKPGFGYGLNYIASFIKEFSFVFKGNISTTEIKNLSSHCLHIISPRIVSVSAHFHLTPHLRNHSPSSRCSPVSYTYSQQFASANKGSCVMYCQL